MEILFKLINNNLDIVNVCVGSRMQVPGFQIQSLIMGGKRNRWVQCFYYLAYSMWCNRTQV